MSYRHLELSSSSSDGISESPPESDQTLNGFINKAAHSLVYKTMAVLLSIRLDVDSNDETWESEFPVGDEIGRILKMIGLVLAVMFVISFVIIPSTVAIVLCCCQQSPASGTRPQPYSSLRQTTHGGAHNGRDYPNMAITGASCGRTYLIGLLFGIPAGIIVGIIAGVNTWPHL